MKVWDPVVRVFHWTVVTGCVLNLFILEEGKSWHKYVGYVVAVALVMRLVWGLVGTPHARFAQFWPTPKRVKAHLAALLEGADRRQLGHSPLGALMMLALMALLAGVSVTGWMMGLDQFWGEAWLEALHEVIANAILVLALLHALAALVESWRHRENLIWSMITGRKRPVESHAHPDDRR